ncbi:hypothetical protein D3C85_710530 [compost metagenome]
MHHVLLDLLYLGGVQAVLEGGHTQWTQHTVQNNLLEQIASRLIGFAQVGNNPAADSANSVTYETVGAV